MIVLKMGWYLFPALAWHRSGMAPGSRGAGEEFLGRLRELDYMSLGLPTFALPIPALDSGLWATLWPGRRPGHPP